jgi:predicted pyridoxine 5'-phosphate oxidase superfamily flavin-nucleotide-binding protein
MPTMKQKIQKYEDVLHQIQMHAQVTMDHDRLRSIIDSICSWSYAHRSGNGEITHKEQQQRIDAAFEKLGT